MHAEGQPVQTENADVSENAGETTVTSDIPSQDSSLPVETVGADASETPSKEPDSKTEATDVKESVQESPHPDEPGTRSLLTSF